MNEDELTQKDIDDYNKRRNEEYQEKTKANEELRKKQEQGTQLDIPGLDQQLGGTAFEIGANLALDAGTSWLLGVPEGFLTKGLYGIANVGGSAIINAIAQKMRGDKFSLGELVGTSAASLIPGAVTGKGVARSALRGATTAGVEQNIRSIVDDNKVLGFGDQVSAFATGGALGTGFDFAGKGISKTEFFRSLADKMNRGKSTARSFVNLAQEFGVTGAPVPEVGSGISPFKGGLRRTPGGDLIDVNVDGSIKQYALFDYRDYTNYKTLGDELVARSFGVIPNPNSPNYSQFQKFNQQVFRPLMTRVGGQDSFYSVLAENPNFSYIEHLIAKGNHMDWYWKLKNADRNAANNVRLLLNDPYKKLKDVVENYGYGTAKNKYNGPFLQSSDVTKRLIVDVEGLPVEAKQGIPAVAQNSPGNIVIREAGTANKPGRVVGKIGDYMDLLFRDEQGIIDGLLDTNVIPRTKYVKSTRKRVNLSENEIRTKFKAWRKNLIEQRLAEILQRKDAKLSIGNKKALASMDVRIAEDMVALRAEYPFLGGRIDEILKDLIARDPKIGDIGGEAGVLARSGLAKSARSSSVGGGDITNLDVTFKNGKKGKVRQIVQKDGTVVYKKAIVKRVKDRKTGSYVRKRVYSEIIEPSDFTPITPNPVYQEQLDFDG